MRLSLNLLSPEKKALLRTGLVFAYAQTMLFIVFLVVAFASGTLLAVRVMVKGTYDDLARRETSGVDETKAVTAEFAKINSYLTTVDDLQQQSVRWSQVALAITDLTPDAVQITDLRIEGGHQVLLQGLARERGDVLAFQSKLEQSPLFKDVKAPLANILQRQNVRFNFDMEYALAPVDKPAEPPKKK